MSESPAIARARADLAALEREVAKKEHLRRLTVDKLTRIDSSLGLLWTRRDELRRRLGRVLSAVADTREAEALGAAIDNGTAGRPPDGR
jgi:hypothetical protein